MSSPGQIVGGIVGAVIGYIVSGFNPYGAVQSASIGMGTGGHIEPPDERAAPREGGSR